MANRASDGADPAEGADPFPWVVSLGCLLVGIALFMHSTMPALAERRELERAEQQLGDDLDATLREARDLRRRGDAVEYDPETVRVEIDGHGMTVQEAIDLHSQDDAPAPGPRGGR